MRFLLEYATLTLAFHLTVVFVRLAAYLLGSTGLLTASPNNVDILSSNMIAGYLRRPPTTTTPTGDIIPKSDIVPNIVPTRLTLILSSRVHGEPASRFGKGGREAGFPRDLNIGQHLGR